MLDGSARIEVAMKKKGLALLWTGVLLVLMSVSLSAAVVDVCYYSGSALHFVSRETASGEDVVQGALRLLLEGPSAAETAAGITSAIPAGVRLSGFSAKPSGVEVELSPDVTAGLTDTRSEQIFQQVMRTMTQFDLDDHVRVMCNGQDLSDFLPAPPPAIYSAPTNAVHMAGGVGLSGKRITISPGHGYMYTGSYWSTQRGGNCGNVPEDFHNLKFCRFLVDYLTGDGAYVQNVRELDLNRGAGPSGHPWWQEAAYAYLEDAGYPCSVYGSLSGVCGSYVGANRGDDDVRSRPLATNLDSRGNTDVYVSIHTNALSGDCSGSSCPHGYDVFYMDQGEHADWGAASQTLAQAVGDNFLSAVQSAGETRADGQPWGCHGSCSAKYGNYGEIRVPHRPATLLEVGFHDSCTSDAPKLEEPFFQSVAMYGVYKGVCQYLGVTPGWAMYSSEVVSSDIPATMAPGLTRTVHVVMRNHGVLWTDAKGFHLGAVGDSDPFTSTTRQTVSADTAPGDTCTFTFNITAPATPGVYVTDWQMVRDGYSWFGPICRRSITVGTSADNTPPSIPTNLSGLAVSQSQVDLAWAPSSDNAGVAGYRIFRNGASVGTCSSPCWSDTSCSANTTYSYQVLAFDDAGNESAQSTALSITTKPATEYIVDNTDAVFTGSWVTGSSSSDRYGADYRYSTTQASETATARWTPTIQAAGNYDVYVWYPQGSNRSAQAPYTVAWNGGSTTVNVNQTSGGGVWNLIASGKPFAAGTSGYVQLGNGTGETSLCAMADAVRFVSSAAADSQAPSVPGGLAVAPVGTTQMRVIWNAASDNVGVTGYRVYRDGDVAGFASSTNFTDNGLLPNTRHSYTVSAYDDAGNQSAQSGSAARYTLSYPPVAQVIAGNRNKQVWYPTPAFGFTSTMPFGAGGAEYFLYAWDKSSTHTFNGSEAKWSSGSLQLSASSEGSWCLHLRGFNAEGVANGQSNIGPYWYDAAAPSSVTVSDEGTWTPYADQLGASWTAASDGSGSGVSEYQYAIGNSSGDQSVRTWTSAGTSTSVKATGLSLTEGASYYIQVRAVDKAGYVGAASASDGITVAPAVSKIGQAWDLQNGVAFALRDKTATASRSGEFWLEEADRSAGIRVLSATQVTPGSLVSVAGLMGLSGSQRVMQADVVGTSGTASGAQTPAPLFFRLQALGGRAVNVQTPGVDGAAGLYNVGLLARCTGRISASAVDGPSGRYFYLDDGSGVTDGSTAGVKVYCGAAAVPASGWVTVAGVVATEQGTDGVRAVLIVRDASDVSAL